jgi:hypothetical protein
MNKALYDRHDALGQIDPLRRHCAEAAVPPDRRTLHRPTDRASFAREAARLARLGLTPRDIGVALGLGTAAVEIPPPSKVLPTLRAYRVVRIMTYPQRQPAPAPITNPPRDRHAPQNAP